MCVDYFIAIQGHPVLRSLAAVQVRSTLTEQTERDFDETRYAARAWDRERRVIIRLSPGRHGRAHARRDPLAGLGPREDHAVARARHARDAAAAHDRGSGHLDGVGEGAVGALFAHHHGAAVVGLVEPWIGTLILGSADRRRESPVNASAQPPRALRFGRP